MSFSTMYKKIGFVVIAMICCVQLSAQQVIPRSYFMGEGEETVSYHFFSRVGFGISTLRYEYSKDGLGGFFNIGIARNLNYNWAIVAGVGVAYHSSSATLSESNYEYLIHVPAYEPLGGGEFDYNVRINGFSETQSATFIQIPFGIRYRLSLGQRYALSVSPSLKLGIPVISSYKGEIDEFTTSGYSYLTHQPHENMPEYGFSTYPKHAFEGDLDLKFNIAASLEIGQDWIIGGNKQLYFGVFCDYGLSSISKLNSHLIAYNPADVANPAINSLATVSEVSTLSVGVVLRFSFNFER